MYIMFANVNVTYNVGTNYKVFNLENLKKFDIITKEIL